MQTLVAGNNQNKGFTLLELLVVVALIAIASAGVGFAMRDSAQSQLEREAQRLAALFESARAQSRTSGVAVRWRVTAHGFVFDGLPPQALPSQWLSPDTRVRVPVPVPVTVLLGPEPIIDNQSVVLTLASQPDRAWQVSTNGLLPFSAQASATPPR